MANDKVPASQAYHNIFKCGRCKTIHGFCSEGEFPNVMPIEKTHRYADCTQWNCPKCGASYDCRKLNGGFLGAGVHQNYVSVNPVSPHQRVIKDAEGRFVYVDRNWRRMDGTFEGDYWDE